jgi:hypothetical protein
LQKIWEKLLNNYIKDNPFSINKKHIQMKRIYFIISFLACSMLNFAQIKTEPLSKIKDPSKGLIYALPKTKIIIEVKTRQIQETPGIYFPYAERYLGLKSVCQSGNVRYEIVGVNITTKAIPDPVNTFLITTGKAKHSPSIELTAEGFLKSINRDPDIKKPCECATINQVDKPCATQNYQTQESSIITQEMQQSSSTAKMAELAATQIFNLRESRINLLTLGQDNNPTDGRSYEIVLSELNRMEKYYTELFTGKQVEKIEVSTFEYDPQKSGEEILFRFSQLKGVVDKTDLGGNPVSINIQKTTGIQTNLVNVPTGNSEKEFSVYYRLPAKAQIKITDGVTTLYNKEIDVAQFGRVMALPAAATTSAEFCPLTGAITYFGK